MAVIVNFPTVFAPTDFVKETIARLPKPFALIKESPFMILHSDVSTGSSGAMLGIIAQQLGEQLTQSGIPYSDERFMNFEAAQDHLAEGNFTLNHQGLSIPRNTGEICPTWLCIYEPNDTRGLVIRQTLMQLFTNKTTANVFMGPVKLEQ